MEGATEKVRGINDWYIVTLVPASSPTTSSLIHRLLPLDLSPCLCFMIRDVRPSVSCYPKRDSLITWLSSKEASAYTCMVAIYLPWISACIDHLPGISWKQNPYNSQSVKSAKHCGPSVQLTYTKQARLGNRICEHFTNLADSTDSGFGQLRLKSVTVNHWISQHMTWAQNNAFPCMLAGCALGIDVCYWMFKKGSTWFKVNKMIF